MAGVLKVSGMGKFLFPAEPRTIVVSRSRNSELTELILIPKQRAAASP